MDRMKILHLSFKYESCTHPAALFDSSSLPWEANKPALADALWKLVKNEDGILPDRIHYVLDGGSLLHRLLWKQGVKVFVKGM